jgi:hypothetical protein
MFMLRIRSSFHNFFQGGKPCMRKKIVHANFLVQRAKLFMIRFFCSQFFIVQIRNPFIDKNLFMI